DHRRDPACRRPGLGARHRARRASPRHSRQRPRPLERRRVLRPADLRPHHPRRRRNRDDPRDELGRGAAPAAAAGVSPILQSTATGPAPAPRAGAPPVLELTGITKTYPGVRALTDVTLTL